MKNLLFSLELAVRAVWLLDELEVSVICFELFRSRLHFKFSPVLFVDLNCHLVKRKDI
jgi:hypothetical protein